MSQKLSPDLNTENESSVPNLPATMQPVESRGSAGRGAARFYLAVFALFQVMVLLATIPLSGTAWFMWHDHYPGLRNFGYSQRVGSPGCEILIYGDSSSLTGMDPSIIEHITGLKTCNISEGITIQSVVGSDMPLQAYLKRNPAPRFLIGSWSATYLHPDIEPYTDYAPEGVTYAMQFGDHKDFFRHLLHKPRWVYKYSLWALYNLMGGMEDVFTGKARHQIDARTQRDARMGQWPYPVPAETRCVRNDMHIDPSTVVRTPESVAAFRRKYSSDATTVLIDVSPSADCDNLDDTYAARTAGLYDNTFERLPIRFFNEGDVHFSPEGARYISEKAGYQILARMHPEAKRAETAQ